MLLQSIFSASDSRKAVYAHPVWLWKQYNCTDMALCPS